jgi:hypothetical protein
MYTYCAFAFGFARRDQNEVRPVSPITQHHFGNPLLTSLRRMTLVVMIPLSTPVQRAILVRSARSTATGLTDTKAKSNLALPHWAEGI